MKTDSSNRADEKWKIVEVYYSKFYGLKFKKRPSEKLVDELYSKMMKISAELKDVLDKNPRLHKRYTPLET